LPCQSLKNSANALKSLCISKVKMTVVSTI
jgi:hypothetical protein